MNLFRDIKWHLLIVTMLAIFGATLLCASLYIARPTAALSWEDFSDLAGPGVAMLALVVATLGWLDNKTTQRLEHQPYLRIGFHRIDIGVLRFSHLKFEIENYGRTPARDIKVRVQVDIYDALQEEEQHVIGKMTSDMFIDEIHPSRPLNLPIHLGQIPTAAYEPAKTGAAAAEVTVWLQYIDIFDEFHEARPIKGRVRFRGPKERKPKAESPPSGSPPSSE